MIARLLMSRSIYICFLDLHFHIENYILPLAFLIQLPPRWFILKVSLGIGISISSYGTKKFLGGLLYTLQNKLHSSEHEMFKSLFCGKTLSWENPKDLERQLSSIPPHVPIVSNGEETHFFFQKSPSYSWCGIIPHWYIWSHFQRSVKSCLFTC